MHLADAPAGSGIPDAFTGSPISPVSTAAFFFNSGESDETSIYPIDAGESPVVYELIRKKSGFSDKSDAARDISSSALSSSFHSSPLGPLPYEGGSIIMPS